VQAVVVEVGNCLFSSHDMYDYYNEFYETSAMETIAEGIPQEVEYQKTQETSEWRSVEVECIHVKKVGWTMFLLMTWWIGPCRCVDGSDSYPEKWL